jgi:hypothetical protein
VKNLFQACLNKVFISLTAIVFTGALDCPLATALLKLIGLREAALAPGCAKASPCLIARKGQCSFFVYFNGYSLKVATQNVY